MDLKHVLEQVIITNDARLSEIETTITRLIEERKELTNKNRDVRKLLGTNSFEYVAERVKDIQPAKEEVTAEVNSAVSVPVADSLPQLISPEGYNTRFVVSSVLKRMRGRHSLKEIITFCQRVDPSLSHTTVQSMLITFLNEGKLCRVERGVYVSNILEQ